MISKHQKNIFYIALTISLYSLFFSVGFSQTEKDKENDSSLEITSDRMRSERGGQKIIFSGNVAITRQGIRIC